MLALRSMAKTACRPSGNSTAVGVGECANSRPRFASSGPSSAKAGDVTNRTNVVAMTSCTKPGAVISSVRMQPPMRSLRSISSDLAPFAAEQSGRDQRVDPATDNHIVGRRHRVRQPPAYFFGTMASTRSGLPVPLTIFNGAAIRIAPLGGSLSSWQRLASP